MPRSLRRTRSPDHKLHSVALEISLRFTVRTSMRMRRGPSGSLDWPSFEYLQSIFMHYTHSRIGRVCLIHAPPPCAAWQYEYCDVASVTSTNLALHIACSPTPVALVLYHSKGTVLVVYIFPGARSQSTILLAPHHFLCLCRASRPLVPATTREGFDSSRQSTPITSDRIVRGVLCLFVPASPSVPFSCLHIT